MLWARNFPSKITTAELPEMTRALQETASQSCSSTLVAEMNR